MDYQLTDTYDESHMFAYRDARLYIQTAFIDAARDSGNPALMQFVNDVLKIHGDINVEVR